MIAYLQGNKYEPLESLFRLQLFYNKKCKKFDKPI